jgi:hypothetical protein
MSVYCIPGLRARLSRGGKSLNLRSYPVADFSRRGSVGETDSDFGGRASIELCMRALHLTYLYEFKSLSLLVYYLPGTRSFEELFLPSVSVSHNGTSSSSVSSSAIALAVPSRSRMFLTTCLFSTIARMRMDWLSGITSSLGAQIIWYNKYKGRF